MPDRPILLVVEDNEDLADLVEAAGRWENMQVVTANTVEQAQELVRTNPIVLAVVDLKLPLHQGDFPVFQGTDFVKWLQIAQPGTPAIAISGDREELQVAQEAGVFSDCFLKVFPWAKLMEAINRLRDEALANPSEVSPAQVPTTEEPGEGTEHGPTSGTLPG